ncbi:MAG: major capsid protein [Magnetococcus sp. DMHC-6]
MTVAMPFSSSVLTGAIDKRRPVQTPILDRHFTRRRQVGTPNVQLEIVDGPEGLAVAISHGVQSRRAPNGTESGVTVTIPRFSEHDTIKASDLIGLREAGGQNLRTLQQVYVRKLDDIRRRFDRTQEYMAIKGCFGQVVDGKGTVIATYDVPSVENVTFSDAAQDNPVDVFDDVGTSLARALGGVPGIMHAYAGISAYKMIRNHPKVLELLTGTASANTLLATGELRVLSGVVIHKFVGVYADLAGTDQVYIPDDEILILSEESAFEVVNGPCETPDGLVAQEWYVDTWQERDPPATFLRVETNPLPVVTRPEAVRRLKVS